MSAIVEIEVERARISLRLRRLEEISVPAAAALLKKSPKWIAENFKRIRHGAQSYHVRIADIEAYQARRTVAPPFPSILESAEQARREELKHAS